MQVLAGKSYKGIILDDGPYYDWECPVCGDICSDPNDYRETMCSNGHVVILGDVGENDMMEAYPSGIQKGA